jgi:integrase
LIELAEDTGDAAIEWNLVDDLRNATYNFPGDASCYYWGKVWHLTRAPHIRHLSEAGNERQGFLAPSDFAKLRDALPAHLSDFAQFGYATGQRSGELKLLTWKMVERDMVEGDILRIPVSITKNRRERILPLIGELAEVIERRRAARTVKQDDGSMRMAETIFHRDGRPVGEFKKAWQTAAVKVGLGRMICRVCGREGVEKKCPDCKKPCKYAGSIFHDFRRSAARNLTQAGVPQAVAMQVTGHLTDAMFRRYNIVVTDDLRAALTRTENYRETEQQKIVAIR